MIRPWIGALAATTLAAGCGGGTPVLSVAEARSHEGRASVTGFLHADGDAVRLCAAVLESYPPQCGMPALVVEGLGLGGLQGLRREGAVAWKEGVTLVGTVSDGVLRDAEE